MRRMCLYYFYCEPKSQLINAWVAKQICTECGLHCDKQNDGRFSVQRLHRFDVEFVNTVFFSEPEATKEKDIIYLKSLSAEDILNVNESALTQEKQIYSGR